MIQDESARAQSQSGGWFVATWVLLGVVSIVLSVCGSAMIDLSFDEPTHCHMESPCSLGTMLSQSMYALIWLWCSFLGSGVVSMMVGWSAAGRTMRAIGAGVAVYAVGAGVASIVLVNAIDATRPQ